MADERIDIVINDKISPRVSQSLKRIAESARKADSAVLKLQKQIAKLNVRAIKRVGDELKRLESATRRLSAANQKTSLTTARVATEMRREEIAAQKVKQETIKTAIAADKLAASEGRAAAGFTAGQAAASRYSATLTRTSAVQDRAAASSRSLGLATASLTRTLAVLVTFGAVRTIFQVDEAFASLRNRLRLTTESAGQLDAVLDRVFDIARKTRTPVEDVATAFQRFDLALKQSGVSQEEVLQATESISAALTISGLSGEEAASGLRQFTQALNKGKLDGDEFRSVMENIPVVADAIAKEIGVARGELLDLAPQGKITAEVLQNSLTNSLEEFRQKLDETQVTTGQAFSLLKTNLIALKREFEEATGESNLLARAVLLLSDNIKTLIQVSAVAAGATGVGFLTKSLVTARIATISLASSVVKLRGALIALSVSFGVFKLAPLTAAIALPASALIALAAALAGAVGFLVIFQNEIKLTADGTVTLGDAFKAVGEEAGKAFDLILGGIRALAPEVQTIGDALLLAGRLGFEGFRLIGNGIGFLADVVRGAVLQLAKPILTAVGLIKNSFETLFLAIKIDTKDFVAVFVKDFADAIDKLLEQLIRPLALLNKARESLGKKPIKFPFISSNIDEFLKDLDTTKDKAALASRDILADTQKFVDELTSQLTVGGPQGVQNFIDESLLRSLEIVKKRTAEIAEARRAAQEGGELGGGFELPGVSREAVELLEKINKPIEDYQENLKLLDELLEAGAISQRAFSNAVGDTALIKKLQDAFSPLGQSNQNQANSQQAALEAQLRERQLILEQAAEAEIISEQTKNNRLLELQEQFAEESDKIDKDLATKRKESLSLLTGAIGESFGFIRKTLEENEGANKNVLRSLFAAEKAFALATVILNTQIAMAKANATLGPIAGPPAALAEQIKGGIAIATILSQTLAGFAEGGIVRGRGTGTSDSIPARLSDGEFVVNAGATSRNRDLLEQINRGRDALGFRNGGEVNVPPSFSVPTSRMSAPAPSNVKVNVFPTSGTDAEVRTRETEDGTEIDIMLKKVDERLAQNFQQNTGSLNQAVRTVIERGF